MKIYKDKDLTEELDELIDLGIVDAGEIEEFEFWLLNDSPHELINLTYELKEIDRETKKVTDINSEEAKVLEAPKNLNPNESGKLLIEYAPLVSIEKGLRVKLQTKGKRLVD